MNLITENKFVILVLHPLIPKLGDQPENNFSSNASLMLHELAAVHQNVSKSAIPKVNSARIYTKTRSLAPSTDAEVNNCYHAPYTVP
jgi:hypothetical protein